MNESWEFFRISDLISFLSSSAKPLASYGRTGVAQTKTKAKKKSCGFKGCVRRLRTIDVVFADINEKLKLFAALGLAPSLAPRLPRLKSLRLFN